MNAKTAEVWIMAKKGNKTNKARKTNRSDK